MIRAMEYSRVYGKWHQYDPAHILKLHRYFRRTTEHLLPRDRDARILEIGCGMGFYLMLLRDLGFRNIEGIDIDRGQVQGCRDRGLNVALVEDSAAYLKDRPESYDLILAFDLLEHLVPDRALELCGRVFDGLKKGGRFLSTVPNASSALAGRLRYICWTHQTSFTEHSLDFLIYHAGFDDIRVFSSGSFLRPRLPFLVRPSVFRWLLLKAVRFPRRLEMIAELGLKEGRAVPLSPELLGVADKR